MGIPRSERDDYRPTVSEAMQKVMGFTDSGVVTAAVKCLNQKLDKASMTSQLQQFMENSAQSFVDEIFTQLDNTRKSRKRKDDDDHLVEGALKKSRRFVEPEVDNDVPKGQAAESPGTLTNTTQQIKAMMEHARAQIEQRKTQLKQINSTVLHATVKASEIKAVQDNSPSIALMNTAIEKAAKAAELQASIQARLAAKPGLLNLLIKPIQATEEKVTTAPQPLILDDQGRTIDSSGQVLNIPSRVPTLKANIRAKKRDEIRQKMTEKITPETSSSTVNYYDNRVKPDTVNRPRRNFKFFEKGRFEKIAQKIRTKAQLTKLQNEISMAAKRTGIQQASKLALITPKVGSESDVNVIPEVEWWDNYVLTTKEEIDNTYSAITNLIEHPIQMKPPGTDNKPAPVLGTYLTKKERKKIRRINRREALKDEQEKIRLGLMPPPEPKVKLSNLMRVLGTDAVQDPTKVEKHVRAQMAKRQKAHEQANAARKLTDEQRKDKRIKKLKEDTSDVVHVTMYRVYTLRDPAKKFKLEMNSKQLYMTGCAVMHPDINIVVVEGGPKAQRKFRRLMMIRIKWDEDKKGKRVHEDEDLPDDVQWCNVVWEGETSQRNFGDMTFKQCTTDAQAKEFFQNHGVGHYWDLCHAQTVLQE